MIGPVVKIDPVSLPRRHNLHWLGMKDYRDLPLFFRLGRCDHAFCDQRRNAFHQSDEDP